MVCLPAMCSCWDKSGWIDIDVPRGETTYIIHLLTDSARGPQLALGCCFLLQMVSKLKLKWRVLKLQFTSFYTQMSSFGRVKYNRQNSFTSITSKIKGRVDAFVCYTVFPFSDWNSAFCSPFLFRASLASTWRCLSQTKPPTAQKIEPKDSVSHSERHFSFVYLFPSCCSMTIIASAQPSGTLVLYLIECRH